MKAVVIDDEPKARKNIIHILNLVHPEISIAGEAEDVKSAYELILLQQPDLVFLDLQMPDGTGFDLLDRFPVIDFKLIFITAFDSYAIEAFKYNAIDYLLKPVNPQKFKEAVDRVILKSKQEDYYTKLNNLLGSMKPASARKIVLKTMEGYYVVKVDDIIRLESDKGYTNFHIRNSKSILVSNIIKGYEEMLSDAGFMRTHQSHLVNMNYVKSFIKADGGYLLMENGDSVPVSKRKRDVLFRMLDEMA